MALKLTRQYQAENVEMFITLALKQKMSMADIRESVLKIAPKNMSYQNAVNYLANFLLNNPDLDLQTERGKAQAIRLLRRELGSMTFSGAVFMSGGRTAKAKAAMLLFVSHVETLRYFYTKRESLTSRADRVRLFDELFTPDVYTALAKRSKLL